jgi:hypothetical protein
MQWLFWNVDFDAVDRERDAELILTRVLERGRLVDVRWLIRQYGLERIHAYFRARARVELSPKTVQFWRLVLSAQEEQWPEPPAFRQNSSAPWIA